MSKSLKDERFRLQAELRVKQEGFVKKERVYKAKIEEQEHELNAIRTNRISWMNEDKGIEDLRKMHADILNKIGQVQGKTVKMVNEQEQELLKAFKHRLSEVQDELEREKSTPGDGTTSWSANARVIERRVDDERARADKEDRLHTALVADNASRNVAASLQADDKEYLIKQLVKEKRHNASLREKCAALEAEAQPLRAQYGNPDFSTATLLGGTAADTSSSSPGKHGAGAGTSAAQKGRASAAAVRLSADHRYQEVLRRLTKVLGAERNACAVATSNLEQHRAAQTPLERGLQECVNTVLANKAASAAATAVRARWLDQAKAQAAEAAYDSDYGGNNNNNNNEEAAAEALANVQVENLEAGMVPEEVEAAAQAAGQEAVARVRGRNARGGCDAEQVALLSWQDRERVLELWLAMDGVVDALATPQLQQAKITQSDSALVLPPV